MKKLLFLVPFFQRIEGTAVGLDIVKRNLQVASATYCDIGQLVDWNCSHCLPEIDVIDVIPDESNIIVARDPVQNATIFAFRGSVNVENWISNLQFDVVAPYDDADVKVHKGLYHEYLLYKDEISKFLVTGDQIVVTGHSSGAAMSMFFAYDIYRDYDVVVVPHIPEEVLGYRHTGTEVWNYDDTDTNYKVCDSLEEDDVCSNSCAPIHCTSTSDHLFYLGMAIGSASCSTF